MKILLINDIGSIVGGAETVVYQLQQSLKSHGHNVKVLSGSIKYHKSRFNDYEFKCYEPNTVRGKLQYIYNPYSKKSLREILNNFQPDVVHLHNISKASISILFLLKHYPTLLTAHDFECVDQTRFDQIKTLHPFKQTLNSYFIMEKGITYFIQKLRYKLIRYAQKNIDIIIAPSQAVARVLNESTIGPPVKVIYNAKSAVKTYPTKTAVSSPPRLLFVGRLTPEKGVHVLIAAMNEVVKKIRPVSVMVAGSGPELHNLKKIADDTGVGNSIDFIGDVQQNKIGELYQNSDIVIIPSTWFEPLGMVALEAMMYSKPIIASRSGGLIELVNDDVGCLVNPGNPKMLAASIVKLLSDPAKMRQMGKNSFKRSRQFNIESFYEQTVETYTNVIKKY